MNQKITIPLVNPNEPEALLNDLYVKEGQKLKQGDLICSLETTKSTQDLFAETEGFIVGLRFKSGERVTAGEILCYLADSPDWLPPAETETPEKAEPLSSEMRISKPARELAAQQGIPLEDLPTDGWITREMVMALVRQREGTPPLALNIQPGEKAIIVYGGGGHGKSLIDLIRVLDSYTIAGIVDDGLERGSQIMGVPVLGGSDMLAEIYAQGVELAVNAVGGIGNIQTRIKVFTQLSQTGFICPVLVHPSAFVEASASLSSGVQVFPQAYIGSESQIGFGAIINTGAIVSHDCTLGKYCNIAPGATLAGTVNIGEGVLVGMQTSVNLNVQIGDYARIGNSATVKKDVPARGIVRAGEIYPSATR